jgi:putative flippase GtrA
MAEERIHYARSGDDNVSQLRGHLPLILRFAGVGLTCAAVYFALCYVYQSALGWGPFEASAAAYACCFGAGYFAQRSLTFRSKVKHRVALPRYAALHAAIALLTSAGTAWVSRILATEPFYTAVVATGLAGVASFAVTLSWIFPIVDRSAYRWSVSRGSTAPAAAQRDQR